MVGPKAAVPPEELLETLLTFDIYVDSNNVLRKKSDEIWKKVCDSLNNRINPINLYFYVTQDRHNILSNYRKEKGLEIYSDKEDEEKKTESIQNEIKKDNSNSDDSNVDCPPKKLKKSKKCFEFEISISKEQWDTIKVIKKVYKNGQEGKSLQQGWCDLLRKSIWEHIKLPCAFNFSRHVINSYNAYIEAEGYCSSCNSVIKATCYDLPTDKDESIKFVISTIDTRGIPHVKKNRLQGKERKRVQEQLKHKKPKQWRRENAAKLMDHGDSEPPFLYSLKSLQKASQEGKNADLGIKKGAELFDSLTDLKSNVEFNKFIRSIGYDKFYISYWSPEQISLNNDIIKKLNHPFALDATSSIGIKLNRPEGDSSELYLTILSTYVNNIILPVCQVISERNDTNFLTFWLSDFKKSGAHSPHVIVTDMGKAIQNSVCLAFNRMTLAEYNDICFSILEKKIVDREIDTQLRTDIAHLQHAVSRWPCFSLNTSKKVKEFYLRCTGFMSSISTLRNFEEFLYNLFYVAGSKTYDVKCGEALKYIANKIRTYKFDPERSRLSEHDHKEYSYTKNEEQELEYEISSKHSKPEKFVEKIKAKVEESMKIDLSSSSLDFMSQLNDYFLPDFSIRLCHLCKEFPCWINVMSEYFNTKDLVASSSRGEALFGQIKNDILENRHPLRTDKIVSKHCRIIDSDTKIARAAVNNLKAHEILTNNREVKNHKDEHLHHTERWRNKISIDLPELNAENVENDPSDFIKNSLDSQSRLLSERDEVLETNILQNSEFDKYISEVEINSVNILASIENNFNDVEKFMEPNGNNNLNERIDVDSNNRYSHDNTNKSNSINYDYNVFCNNVKHVSTLVEHNTIHTIEDPNCANTNSLNDLQLISKEKEQKYIKSKIVEVKTIENNEVKENKIRGIYVSPDPDFMIVISGTQENKKAKRSKKHKSNIQNGNSLSERLIANQKINLINTCPFDSISELLIHSCGDSSFYNFIERSKNDKKHGKRQCYASSILVHCESGANAMFYACRFYILHSFLPTVNFTIDCNQNLSFIFTHLMSSYETTTELITCACGYKKEEKKCVLPLPNVHIVWDHQFKNLEDEFKSKYENGKFIYCEMCHQSSASVEYLLGPYLYIDTDDAYAKSPYAIKQKINVQNLVTNLNDVPTTITIKQQMYVLRGVIRYQPPKADSSLGHYIAYCRTARKHWIEKNDLVKESVLLSNKALPSIKISAIFYVKCQKPYE